MLQFPAFVARPVAHASELGDLSFVMYVIKDCSYTTYVLDMRGIYSYIFTGPYHGSDDACHTTPREFGWVVLK